MGNRLSTLIVMLACGSLLTACSGFTAQNPSGGTAESSVGAPTPSPAPAVTPTTMPSPAPAPAPMPVPKPAPAPAPAPMPVPKPAPAPAPAPMPVPKPAPAPTPAPAPAPNPISGLPAGVTLRAIDGGQTYYASNGFTKATQFPTNMSGGWDNPGFIPIGSFLGALRSDTVSYWNDLGWTNGFTIDGSSDYSVARSNNISVLANYGDSGIGAETVGFDGDDEPSDFSTLANGIRTESNAQQAGRFWWLNLTWNQIEYGTVNGTPGDGSYESMFFTPISMPSGGTNKYAAASNDFYFFDEAGTYYLSVLYNMKSATTDQIRRGFLYGDYIDSQRQLLGTHSDGSGLVPLWSLVETGGAYTQNTTAASYIQPAELNQAVWMSFIHGARGIIYFDHSFAGPAQSDNNMFETYYQTAANFPNTGGYANPNGVSMYAQVKATDALVSQLAPVINSPFAIGYVSSVTPAGVTCLLPCQTDGSSVFSTIGIDFAVKWYTGGGSLANGAYILASPRASETAKNISATFTLKDASATTVTVVGENRTLSISSSHQFTDNFATGLTVHIYQIH